MATGSSFKQQCPSCEAMVPIRDRKLIGKKVDCPNCKYRFVVEEPAANGDETEIEDRPKAKRKGAAAEAKPKFKAKKPGKSGSGVMIMGGVLTVVAVGLLGVGAYYIFFKPDGDKRPTGQVNITTGSTQQNTNPNSNIGPGPVVAGFDLSNLLPNDSQIVIDAKVKGLLQSPVGSAAFFTPGAFNKQVRDGMIGMPIGDIERLLYADNETQGWQFLVLRTGNKLPVDDLKTKLGLQPAKGGTIKNRAYFEGNFGPWLDNFFAMVASDLRLSEIVKPKKTQGAAYFYDEKTLILADLVPLKKFLDDNAEPQLLLPAVDPDVPNAPVQPAYRTLRNPAMKSLLDRLEPRPDATLVSMALDVPRLKINAGPEVIAVGAALQQPPNNQVPTLVLGTECSTLDQAVGFVPKLRQLAAPFIGPALKFGIDLQVENVTRPANLPPPMNTVMLRANVVQQKTTVLLNLDANPPEQARNLIIDLLRPQMVYLRGLADMATGQLRLHQLGTTLRAYSEQHGMEFPRATIARPVPPSRLNRPWPPSEEISWMAALLPHLGPEYAAVGNQLKFDQSWRDPQNLRMGAALIPHFLDPATPRENWWVTLTSLPDQTLAATQFVGIAGVGLDAADPYERQNPMNKDKLGVFGFDRGIKLDQLKDGGANTIAVIQVPPTYKRPWIAGGGATVQGVPAKDSFKPFLIPQKKGTIVLMADGSVRFIAEGISDDVFKAMCTVQGAPADQVKQLAVPIPAP